MAEATESSVPAIIGEALKRAIFALQDYAILAVRSAASLFSPPIYLTDIFEQMDVIGVGSLPIILLASLSIGGVMVLQTAAQFERFGETSLTGDAVALALVRELGPTITALLVAGRNASGMASELGSMVVTEQVDAMRALGTDPIRRLLAPRLAATVLVVPLLTGVFDFIGLCGGYIVSSFELRLSASTFWNHAIQALEFGDLVQGLAKPVLFGFMIATIGCYQGLRVRGGTRGVGRATTMAVVVASVSILVSDFFFSRVLLFLFHHGH